MLTPPSFAPPQFPTVHHKHVSRNVQKTALAALRRPAPRFGNGDANGTITPNQAPLADAGTSARIQAANAALQRLQAAKNKPTLDPQDEMALTQYRKLLHLPETVPGPPIFSAQYYNTLATTSPTKRTELLNSMANSLKASIAASQDAPMHRKLGDQNLIIHNTQIGNLLKPSYSADELDQTFKTLQRMGVFGLRTHQETGLPYTTEATFNKAMNFQWHTDSVEIGRNLQRFLAPQDYRRNMLANASVMNSERVHDAVQNVIQDPNWYRESPDPMHGLPHIFNPDSIKPDPVTGAPDVSKIGFDPNWHNQKRLESPALLMRALIDNYRDGLVPNQQGQVKPWGFNHDFLSNPAQAKLVTNAIGNMAVYLSRVNLNPATGHYDMKAPSASSWEEQALAGGCTSDTGDAVLAFESLRDLMHNPKYNSNPGIQQVRKDLSTHQYAKYIPTKPQMDEIINTGHQVIHERVVVPLSKGQTPRQSEARDADTSLTFLNASDYAFEPTDVVKDTKIRLALLHSMEKKLMKPNGMMRYGENVSPQGDHFFDSYLQLNSHVPEEIRKPELTLLQKKLNLQPYPKDAMPSHDVTDKQGQLQRQSGCSVKYTAQWGLGVSAGLQTLAASKTRLLTTWIQRDNPPTKEEQMLLAQVDHELNRYVNKNLALITGKDTKDQTPISSTGLPLSENKVMEAYEYVLNLDHKPTMLPGAHPLTWGESQLFDGMGKAVYAARLQDLMNAKFRLAPKLPHQQDASNPWSKGDANSAVKPSEMNISPAASSAFK